MPITIDADGGSVLGLEALLNGTDTYYVAVFNDAPTDDGGGTECADTSYARVAFANWQTSGDDTRQNTTIISFPLFDETQLLAAWGIFDAASGGTLLCWDSFRDVYGDPDSVTVFAGDRPEFDPTDLKITLVSCLDEES